MWNAAEKSVHDVNINEGSGASGTNACYSLGTPSSFVFKVACPHHHLSSTELLTAPNIMDERCWHLVNIDYHCGLRGFEAHPTSLIFRKGRELIDLLRLPQWAPARFSTSATVSAKAR
jgi:hypothetical protein